MRANRAKSESSNKSKKPLNIQKNPKLKALLLSKFKAKHKGKHIPDSIIAGEIDKFMQNTDMTIDQIRELERQVDLKVYQFQGTSEANQKKAIKRQIDEGKKDANEKEMSAQKQEKTDENELMPKGEEDEWATFMKLKDQLYREELKQEIEKKKDNVKFINDQLNQQLSEKMDKKNKSQYEEAQYVQTEKERIDLINEMERQKEKGRKDKAENEKKDRMTQILQSEQRKKTETVKRQNEDRQIVDRIKQEINQEKEFLQYKKNVAKETLKQMMEETEKERKRLKDEKDREMQDDIRAQKLYLEMLNRQDAERDSFFKSKNSKNQNLIDEVVQSVIDQQKTKVQKEEEAMKKAEKTREERERKAEELRLKLDAQNKKQMRDFLYKQIEEKKIRAQEEVVQSKEQRSVFIKQFEDFKSFEDNQNKRIKEVNKEHQEYLKHQMDLAQKAKKQGMTQAEYLINKQLIEDAKKRLNQ